MPLTAEKRSDQRQTHQEIILEMIQKAGVRGCTSEELCQVTWRFSGRLFDLRAKGWQIDTLSRTGTDAARFILKAPDPVTLTQQSLF